MDELLDLNFDPSFERDLFGPLPDAQTVKFARRTGADKRPPKPVGRGLSPGILVPAPRAA
jgi:hypothetical protein